MQTSPSALIASISFSSFLGCDPSLLNHSRAKGLRSLGREFCQYAFRPAVLVSIFPTAPAGQLTLSLFLSLCTSPSSGSGIYVPSSGAARCEICCCGACCCCSGGSGFGDDRGCDGNCSDGSDGGGGGGDYSGGGRGGSNEGGVISSLVILYPVSPSPVSPY